MTDRTTLTVPLALALVACGGPPDNPDLPFGATAIVAVVNPVVNTPNTTTVPAVGGARGGVVVDAQPGGQANTDASGLAVVGDLAVGATQLVVGGAPGIPLTIAANGDVYDAAVALNGSAATMFPNFPIRYAVGGQIMRFDSGARPADVAAALGTRDTIVFFRNGTYNGDLTITGDNVIFFGEGFTERQVVINGSVTVRGTGVRIRGFTITGSVTVNGNDFGMAYSVVRGRTQILGNAVAFLRNAFCGEVTVPSSNATLLDNDGVAPLPAPPAALCR